MMMPIIIQSLSFFVDVVAAAVVVAEKKVEKGNSKAQSRESVLEDE